MVFVVLGVVFCYLSSSGGLPPLLSPLNHPRDHQNQDQAHQNHRQDHHHYNQDHPGVVLVVVVVLVVLMVLVG